MLSPHTPPGTKIVCINAEDTDNLKLNAVYTLTAIHWGNFVGPFGDVRYTIHLEEALPNRGHNGFAPQRFRKAELPKCLTDLLVTKYDLIESR